MRMTTSTKKITQVAMSTTMMTVVTGCGRSGQST